MTCAENIKKETDWIAKLEFVCQGTSWLNSLGGGEELFPIKSLPDDEWRLQFNWFKEKSIFLAARLSTLSNGQF